MSSHFLLSAKARTLSLSAVLRMTDEEAEAAFIRIRWHATDGEPVCPACECPTVYDCRKANGAPRFRCKACRKDFSITSGTLFAFHKMPLRQYLAAIAIFCNEVKGKSGTRPMTENQTTPSIEISFDVDMIERVMREWQEENPLRSLDNMPSDEFARRMMIEMKAAARLVK